MQLIPILLLSPTQQRKLLKVTNDILMWILVLLDLTVGFDTISDQLNKWLVSQVLEDTLYPHLPLDSVEFR